MNRTRFTFLALLTLVALLALAPTASAKTLAALPDLVVQKVSKPPKAEVLGEKVKMVVKVRNVGAAEAGKSKLGLYLGAGKKHRAKDKRLKRVKVKPLAAGKTRKLKLRVTLPANTTPGSYRFFACADDRKELKEAKERNCKATRKIRLSRLNPGRRPITLPDLPPSPAFTMTDGIDWGFVQNAQEETPGAGDPVTLTLTAGNGIPGQGGYARSSVPSEGFRTGATTILSFTEDDDGIATLPLPFAFPFGGVKEQTISVSTNGWVSFGSPAWDYWNDNQADDYRGIQAVVGEMYRGLMPYWSDLTLKEGGKTGMIKQVVAPDGSWVAYQWDVFPLSGGTAARRTFQLVLFPDGRFRFDYPGENAAGGEESFVGSSLGTGPTSAEIVSAEGTEVPASGQLFTPKALPVTGDSEAGEIGALLPKGSSFLSSSPGCSLTTAPAKFSTGLVTCAVPSIAAGTQATQTVTFAMPGHAPGEGSPANFRLLGSYSTGSLKLTDGDEIDGLNTNLAATTITLTSEYTGGNIEAGVPTTFEVDIDPINSGLDEPTATFSIANATLSEIKIAGEPIECTALGGASATCVLPSGTSGTEVELTVVPASIGALKLQTTARALNAPEVSANISIFP